MPSGGQRRDPLRQQLLPAGQEVLRRRVHPVRNVLGEVQLRLEGDCFFPFLVTQSLVDLRTSSIKVVIIR
jgi:hypothetical protein